MPKYSMRAQKYRRKYLRRKRVIKRMRRFVRRIPRIANYTHTFKRSVVVANWQSNGVSNQNHVLAFRMNQIPNLSEFTNLFDVCKVKKVVYTIEPCFNINSLSSANAYSLKKIRYVHDYDDETPLASEDAYLEYGNCRSVSCNKTVRIPLYPKIAQQVFNTGLLSSYAQKKPMWLDFEIGGGANVPHYGIKIQQPYLGNPADALEFRVLATVTFMCRQQR